MASHLSVSFERLPTVPRAKPARKRQSARWFEKIPWGSIGSGVVCSTGALLFSVTNFSGMKVVITTIQNVFIIDMNWLNVLQMMFIVLGVVCVLFSWFQVAVGYYETEAAATIEDNPLNESHNWYLGSLKHHLQSEKVGYWSNILLNTGQLVWIAVFLWCALMMGLALIPRQMCLYTFPLPPNITMEYNGCLDFRQVDFLFPEYVKTEDLVLCNERMDEFCEASDYCVKKLRNCLIGIILLTLGQSMFIATLTGNLRRMRNNEKYFDMWEYQRVARPFNTTHTSC